MLAKTRLIWWTIFWMSCTLALLLVLNSIVHAQSIVTPVSDITVTGSATSLRAAEASVLNCTNNDPSVNIRVGDSTVSSSKGQRIFAGASFKIVGSYAVFAISEGASVTVSCTKEIR